MGWLSLDEGGMVLQGVRMADVGNVAVETGEGFRRFSSEQ